MLAETFEPTSLSWNLPRAAAYLHGVTGSKGASGDPERDIWLSFSDDALESSMDEGGAMGVNDRLETPCHPGGYVRRNVIEPRNLTVMDAASLLDVTRQTLFDFLDEKTGLSPDLALRIETVFGVEMDTLMEMQTQFDIAEARKRLQNVQSELAAKARSPMPAQEAQAARAVPRTIIRRGPALG
jgi:antitoxin HigA-1